ncbi:hypothetical protein [Marmoricola sp. URHB0036]|uniref:hypothetical protein n=1 Tax=Marmoricola sp. URHB0036 TaxID=1298863 RepID=UPI0012DFA6EE|nr:hypothetical protein [Marmoricola sp. URHB0036]
MGAGDLASLEAVLTRRFLFNAFAPVLIFLAVDATMILALTDQLQSAFAAFGRLEFLPQVLITAGYVSAAWFVAVIVAGRWRDIVRLFEGYPVVALFKRVGKLAPGVVWHRNALLEVRQRTPDSTRAYYSYPRERWLEDVLPTRLGNILLSAEKYPIERYGIDPIIFWPRLYPLIPPQFQRDYEEFVREYEFPLVVSFLAGTSGCLLAMVCLLTTGAPLVFMGLFLGCLAVAYVFYVLSLGSAVQMAEQQRTAFDLYRGLLLDAWPSVADVQDEKKAFDLIADFVVLNSPARWEQPQGTRLGRRRADRDLGEGRSGTPPSAAGTPNDSRS